MLSRATVQRLSRPTDVQKLRLPDGARVLVRPIREQDAAAFAHAYRRLSADSLRRRHLNAAFRLTARDLQYLTAVDHREHVAFVAVDPATGDILGSARYIRLPARPNTAEMAVEVIDAWQRRGIGRLLLRRLSHHAEAHGIDEFSALLAADNLPMQRALRGAIASIQADGADLEYTLNVPALGQRVDASTHRRSRWMLRIPSRLANMRLPGAHAAGSALRQRRPAALPAAK